MKYLYIANTAERIGRILLQCTFFFGILFLLPNCDNDPSFLGRDLLPPSDNVLLKVDTTTRIVAYTSTAIPIITSFNKYYLLGSQNDPIFGLYQASVFTQLRIAFADNLSGNRTVDSLILQLSIKDYFGDSLAVQTLRLFEVTEDIKIDSSYFSNTNIEGMYYPFEIGSAAFIPKDTLIRVNISNPGYISKFLLADDSVFMRNSAFMNVFKGLYFKVDEQPVFGGALSSLDLAAEGSKLTLYYAINKVPGDTVNQSFDMVFGTEINSVNLFNNDFSTYPSSAGLDNPDYQDTVLFLTSMAGLNVKFRFPELEEWRLHGRIAVIKAELLIGVEDSVFQYNNHKLFPGRLLLYSVDAAEKYRLLYDYHLQNDLYGGFYSNTEKAYKVNITYHFQSYIDKKIENSELILITSNNSFTPNRVLLKSPLAEGKGRMKLRIIYTEL